LETYEHAMECLRSRSVKKLFTSEYLLTGLLTCGKCGAKMRYQKWGKNGCKLVCYSQDKSKTHLMKDPDCDNAKVWADDVEDAVVKDLFRFCVAKKREMSSAPEQTVVDILNEQYAALSTKVKRLYTLYASSANPLLLETIEEHQTELSNIMKQITLESERNTIGKKIRELKTNIDHISDVWDTLTPTERQDIVRTLTNRVTVTSDGVCIDYIF